MERIDIETTAHSQMLAVTERVQQAVDASGVREGVCHLYVPHTTAALTVNENADPSVRVDFESMFNRLVPENEPYLTHTIEGPDDMPAHVKSALVGSSIMVPITNGKLNLGTWQGIYLCEFRNNGGKRKLVATIWS